MQLRRILQPLIHSTAAVRLAFTMTTQVGAAELGPRGSEADLTNYMWNVRDFGAKGDGRKLDTEAINRAIDACSGQGGGKVLLPPGRYRSGTIHLRSQVALFLDAGAVLIGTTNLDHYAQPTIPAVLPEAKWGKWHRALIVGENLEDISIVGQGLIDGNKVFDPTGEEKMRGPHTIAFVNCRRFSIRDVTIVDSANYAVFFQVSDDVEIQRVREGYQPTKNEVTRGYRPTQHVDMSNRKIPKNLGDAAVTPQSTGTNTPRRLPSYPREVYGARAQRRADDGDRLHRPRHELQPLPGGRELRASAGRRRRVR